MITNKKWIAYGVAGAVGLSLVGGAAAATAANMSLSTTDGSVVPGGPLVGGKGKSVIDGGGLLLRVSDTSASVATATSPTPSPTNSATQDPTVSAVSAASPVAPPAPAPAPPAPAPAPAPAPDSGGSVGSAWSD